MKNFSRILARKKHPETNLQKAYGKFEYEHLVFGTSNQHFIRGSYTDTKYFVIGLFLFCPFWLLASVVFCGNIALSIVVLSTEKLSSFLKKVFVFQEICFKVAVLKMFEVSSDCHTKTGRSLEWSTISRIARIYALPVNFK